MQVAGPLAVKVVMTDDLEIYKRAKREMNLFKMFHDFSGLFLKSFRNSFRNFRDLLRIVHLFSGNLVLQFYSDGKIQMFPLNKNVQKDETTISS